MPARVADRRRDAASRPAPRGGPARGVRAESRVRSAAGSRRMTRPVPRAASRVPPRRVAACEPRAANESSDEKEDERRRDSKGRGGFGRPRKVRPITPEPRNPGILGRPRPDRRQSRSSHDERLPRSLRQRPPHAAACVLRTLSGGRRRRRRRARRLGVRPDRVVTRFDADVAHSVACNLSEGASREDGRDVLRGVANGDADLRTTARREAVAQCRRLRETATAHQRRAPINLGHRAMKPKMRSKAKAMRTTDRQPTSRIRRIRQLALCVLALGAVACRSSSPPADDSAMPPCCFEGAEISLEFQRGSSEIGFPNATILAMKAGWIEIEHESTNPDGSRRSVREWIRADRVIRVVPRTGH